MVLSGSRRLRGLLHITHSRTKGGPESYDAWNRSALQCASRRVIVNGRLIVCAADPTKLAGTNPDRTSTAAR